MHRIALAAAALLAATPALAQPSMGGGPSMDGRPMGPPPMGGRPPREGPPPGGGVHVQLFISPSGEPFRGQDGLTDWFAGADADKDGALTLAELRADAMRFFKVLDANGDGQIDGAENGVYETKIAPEITRLDLVGGHGGPPGKKPLIRKIDRKAQPRTGAARFGLLNEPQPVRGADADLNQRVSSEEWAKAARRRFELLDTDQDGKITPEQLRPRLER